MPFVIIYKHKNVYVEDCDTLSVHACMHLHMCVQYQNSHMLPLTQCGEDLLNAMVHISHDLYFVDH